MVVCGKVGKLIRFLSQRERGRVPFTVRVGTRCMYLEPIQMYIAQGKPNKSHTTILEKDLTKRIATVASFKRKVSMDIDVHE